MAFFIPGLLYWVIQAVFWSGENKGLDTTNIRLLKDAGIKVVEILVSIAISLDDHNNLHEYHGGSVTVMRYWARDTCSVCLTTCCAIWDEFILPDVFQTRLLINILRIKLCSELELSPNPNSIVPLWNCLRQTDICLKSSSKFIKWNGTVDIATCR